MTHLLDVQGLRVSIPTRFGDFTAVDNVDLSVMPGEIHGLVGESGAGKSTIGAAIIGLLETPAHIASGSVYLQGELINAFTEKRYQKLRGNRISMIFQDPQTSLNPLLRIQDQLTETILQHSDIDPDKAFEQAVALLEETGIENAEQRMQQYPHQFSGGMRQRVVIALALCTNPELIIADEPTTALDVSVQKQILALIRKLARNRGVGVILITHDIGVIAEITDRVTVLRYGRVVETGTTKQVLGKPEQPYSKALMAAVPRLDTRLERFLNIASDDHRIDGDVHWSIEGANEQTATTWLLEHSGNSEASLRADATSSESHSFSVENQPVLQLDDVGVVFGAGQRWFTKRAGFRALNNINLHVNQGEVMGIVGESGSGKSTLAKAIVGLVPISEGFMHFKGQPLPDARQRPRQHPARRDIQMVFQDPYSSLNNRRTVEAILTEPLRFYQLANKGAESRKLVASVLELVEMPQRAMLKYPHQFSGGQRQRIAVARALLARPSFLICDEPTSALDVSIQAQILNLLKDLQSHLELTILFISHNLAVVRQMADRVLVLRNGQQVESADSESFFSAPNHAYSQQLLRESPSLEFLERA